MAKNVFKADQNRTFTLFFMLYIYNIHIDKKLEIKIKNKDILFSNYKIVYIYTKTLNLKNNFL